MGTKKNYLYFLIDKLDEINLDYAKNIGAILILRKTENLKFKEIQKFQKRCISHNIALYIANNVKLLFKLKSNNFYISAYNKQQFNHLRLLNSKIDIIGSAHNSAEINQKIKQGCSNILLSRLFKTNYKNKKGWLGTIRFNLLTRKSSANFIALGGINKNNFSKLKMLNIVGFALSSNKKKAGNYLPAFYKN